MLNNLSKFKNIDWNFKDSKTNHSTHDFHPYPAKFIPQIPNHLISIFTKEKDIVYDPFCGSGTTIVEAILTQRQAIGNDVNPLAVLISKVKSTFMSEYQIQKIKEFLIDTEISVNSLYGEKTLFNNIYSIKNIDLKIPNLKYWFDENVICELSLIKEKILSIYDPNISDFLKIAFSSIIVPVSYQDSNTRYVKVKKTIKPRETFKKFRNKVFKMLEKIKSIPYIKPQNMPKIKVADIKKEIDFESNIADIVITSPPYPNAYDYHLYHKYRMYWLDMDPLKLKNCEIGSHANYSKRKGSSKLDFKEDMKKSFIQISQILKKKKLLCIIIGDSIIKGEKVKNNEILKDVSKETFFKFHCEIERKIKLTKKSFNPKIGNIKTEYIMVFENNKTE